MYLFLIKVIGHYLLAFMCPWEEEKAIDVTGIVVINTERETETQKSRDTEGHKGSETYKPRTV